MKRTIRSSRFVTAVAAPILLLAPLPGAAHATFQTSGARHDYVLYARPATTKGTPGTVLGHPYFIGYGPIKNAFPEITPNTSTRCLDAELTSQNNPDQNYDYVQIWKCNGNVNQSWTFSDLGNGWYSILNEYGNNSALTAENDANDDPSSNGDAVWMWSRYFGGCEQQWQPVTVRGSPGSNDYLAKIVNKCTSKVLDAEYNDFTTPNYNGDYVQLWSYLGGDNQKWHG